MGATKGRRQRPKNAEPQVALYALVRPTVKSKVNASAAAMGVSIADYLERLVEQDQLDENGAPLWAHNQHRLDDDGSLPLARSA